MDFLEKQEKLGYNVSVDDGFGNSDCLSLRKKSQCGYMWSVMKDFCVNAALSHYVLAFIMYVEYTKVQVVMVFIACMNKPHEDSTVEHILHSDKEETVSNCEEELCPSITYKDEDKGNNYSCVREFVCLYNMEVGKHVHPNLTKDDLTKKDLNFYTKDVTDSICGTALGQTNSTIPVYTLSLSEGNEDLTLYDNISRTINFIDGSYQRKMLSKEFSYSTIFPGMNETGITRSKQLKLYGGLSYKKDQKRHLDPIKRDHEDQPNVTVDNENINKTAYRSNNIHHSACHSGASSLFSLKSTILVLLMCLAMVSFVEGGPVMDKGKMIDKHGTVFRHFPLLQSNWCINPEITTNTCPNKNYVLQYKVAHCQFQCPSGEKVHCMEYEDGMVFFCIGENRTCVEGIGWEVDSIESRGYEKFVVIKESACPAGYYQSLPSKCYNACETKHEPLDLIPPIFKIFSMGNNTHPTLIRCNYEDGFYNPENKSFINFDESLEMNFCIHISRSNPCRNGQMPLYNGTCVNHCSSGFIRDETDFLCKLNGTVEPADNGSSKVEQNREIEVGKDKGKGKLEKKKKEQDDGIEDHGEKKTHEFPWLVIGLVLLLLLIVAIPVIKVRCFPNENVPPCVYYSVSGNLTDSNTSSQTSVKAVSDDSKKDSADDDGASEGNIDDITLRKEVVEKQPLIEEKNNPVKASCSGDSGTIVKKGTTYMNNLILKIKDVGTINLGEGFSTEDEQEFLKKLCDGKQILETPNECLLKKSDSQKTIKKQVPPCVYYSVSGNLTDSNTSSQTSVKADEEESEKDIFENRITGEKMTLAKERGAGEELASPYNKTLTQIVINGFAEYMKSVGALIFNGEVIGTVFRAGDDYLMTAFHVIRRIIDPHHTGQTDFTLLEAENVFINFNAAVCETPEYKFRVRNIFPTDTPLFDFSVLQITNRNDALPKGLKLDKRPLNRQTKTLLGIGYGDPENTYSKVLDQSCPIITSISARILECEKWLYNDRVVSDQNVPSTSQNGANVGQTCVERFRSGVQAMGNDPDIVDRKGYKEIDRDQHIFVDICMEHRGSGSPFLTDNGFVKGILTCGHPEFYYLLPKIMKAGVPSDKRFECILKLEYVYLNIFTRNPILANKLFG